MSTAVASPYIMARIGAIEFMRRGVRVTATDLSPPNVALAKGHFELAGI